MDTKDQILNSALELFSLKGFYAASVRDIAAHVGIKDSSLYFHYKNKQAILDALRNKFVALSEKMMQFMSNSVDSLTDMDDELFLFTTRTYISSYFLNDFIRKFISVMNHEQSQNVELREEYISWCIKKPIEYQQGLFLKLQEIGYLKRGDPAQMAIAYYAPIYLLFNGYKLQDSGEEGTRRFIEEAVKTTETFLEVYKENMV